MGQRAKYENKNPVYRLMVGRFLGGVRKALGCAGGQRVLDVGCAEGFVIKYLKKNDPALSFYGMDVDGEALAAAKILNPDEIFEKRSVYDLAGFREKFNTAMVLEVLEHLQDYRGALKVLHDLNADNFIFSVPNEPFFRGINFLRGRYLLRWGNIPEHVNTWGKRRFKEIIGERFEIIGDYSVLPWTIILCHKKNGASR